MMQAVAGVWMTIIGILSVMAAIVQYQCANVSDLEGALTGLALCFSGPVITALGLKR